MSETQDGKVTPYVKTVSTEHTAGIFVGNELGCVGLVAQDGQPPYLVLWGKNEGLPALAIGSDGGHDAFLQVHVPGGRPSEVRHVPMARVLAALAAAGPVGPSGPPEGVEPQ